MTSLVTRLLHDGPRRTWHTWGDIGTGFGVGRLMDSPPPVATSRALSLIGGLFYVTGGLVAVATALAHRDTDPHNGTILLVGVTAVLAGLALARFADSIPVSARRAMNFVGTGLILAVVLLAGSPSAGHALYWVFCFAPIDAFLLFPWRWALPMFGWLLGATAIATFGGHAIPPGEWLVVVVVESVTAFAIGWLVQFAAAGVRDPGTEMLNRRGFERDLGTRCSTGSHTGRRFAIATISLSGPGRTVEAGFRTRNEVTMTRLAALWRHDAPPAATWARIGDAEFAVLWDDTTGFDEYLEKVRAGAASSQPVSIGASDFQPGHTPIHLLAEATSGAAFSERQGGNRVTRAGLINDHVEELRAAIEHAQVVPFYQPVVDLGSGRVVGAEALARWMHPQRGLIGPDVFIPLAEQSGLIHLLGEEILRRACRDAATWPHRAADRDESRPIRVAVNVSGVQLREDRFVEVVAGCLSDAGLPAASLTLEVTESTVAADDPTARLALDRLRQTGVNIAIDDFGTGYSNLARLANLPIDVLKIDRSFICQLDGPGHGQALVRAIVALAEGLGLRTVVEGIERVDQADFVTTCGAHQGQGWLFGRPVADLEFRAIILGARERLPGERGRPASGAEC